MSDHPLLHESRPAISVVIPAYNSESTIRRTLDSVLAQTLKPVEILVVDDGSKDRTGEIVSAYGSPVRLIQQANAGPSAARNHGIREAKGEWIALLDSDDAWLPEKLERQAAQMSPEIALVHCFAVGQKFRPTQEITFELLWKHNYIGTSTVVVRREAILAAGGFDPDRSLIGAEDYNTWLRLLIHGYKIKTVREELILYTPAPNSLSQQVERVIRGELLNVGRIAQYCEQRKTPLPAEQIRWKKAALLNEYGRALFWSREMPLARKYYGELLRVKPTWEAMKFWLATFMPASLLDRRRTQTQS